MTTEMKKVCGTKIFDARHIDIKAPLFLALAVTNSDGTFYCEDVPEGFFGSADDALQHLKEQAEEYGMEGCVFICQPIMRVKTSRRFSVQPLPPSPAKPQRRKK